jgi:DNA-binding MarR family transcriptional regulator
MLFSRMADKYGGTTTLNELKMLNYGFVRFAQGKDISVTRAAQDLEMPKSTVSRILTDMRAKGFVTEEIHPSDGRRRVFRLAEQYLEVGDADITKFLDWCATPGNELV